MTFPYKGKFIIVTNKMILQHEFHIKLKIPETISYRAETVGTGTLKGDFDSVFIHNPTKLAIVLKLSQKFNRIN